MFDYYIQLRRDTGLPVLPIALFLRVGLDGIGWDAYEEHFWEQRIVRFEYAYVGLPALDGEPYATGENLLGVALSALMRLPAGRRGVPLWILELALVFLPERLPFGPGCQGS
jgi:hypothetical protein